MKPQYVPKTLDQKLGKLIEECGEVVAAVGKSIRWGLASVNPELPPEKQETNRDWILREIEDLKEAIMLAEKALRAAPPPPEAAGSGPHAFKCESGYAGKDCSSYNHKCECGKLFSDPIHAVPPIPEVTK